MENKTACKKNINCIILYIIYIYIYIIYKYRERVYLKSPASCWTFHLEQSPWASPWNRLRAEMAYSAEEPLRPVPPQPRQQQSPYPKWCRWSQTPCHPRVEAPYQGCKWRVPKDLRAKFKIYPRYRSQFTHIPVLFEFRKPLGSWHGESVLIRRATSTFEPVCFCAQHLSHPWKPKPTKWNLNSQFLLVIPIQKFGVLCGNHDSL